MKSYVILFRDHLNKKGALNFSVDNRATDTTNCLVRFIQHIFLEDGLYDEFDEFKSTIQNMSDKEIMNYINEIQDFYDIKGIYEEILA